METKVRKKFEVELVDFPEEFINLILDLTDKEDYHKKTSAKNSLIYLGNSILPQLNSLLNSDNYELRIIAAKIIQQIKSEESIDTFLSLITDEDSSIRWIAAKGLVSIGRVTIVPLLKKIMKLNGSDYLKWGAHYVLVNLFDAYEKEEFKTLLLSLSRNNYINFLAPLEATKALRVFLGKDSFELS
jgi:hypothetical protein